MFAVRSLPSQRGSTLLEVMLACSLSLFLLLTMGDLYLACRRMLGLQQAIADLQENGRFAVHFLTENIRMAGYAACINAAVPVNQDQAIVGFGTKLPSYLQGKVLSGTDSLVIGRCRSLNGQTNFFQYAYFVGATTRKNALGQTIYALYTMPITGNKEELVSGVSNLKISYGIGSANGRDISTYLSAEAVKDWTQVRSVQLALWLDSENPVLKQPLVSVFQGIPLPSDRFLHREWDTYVALRER